MGSSCGLPSKTEQMDDLFVTTYPLKNYLKPKKIRSLNNSRSVQ
jgi:hypothetical protein